MNIPDKEYDCICSNNPKILQSREHIFKDCPRYSRGMLLKSFSHLSRPTFSLSSLFRRDSHPLLARWLRKSSAFTKLGTPWELLPSNPHDPGPSAAVIEVSPADREDIDSSDTDSV